MKIVRCLHEIKSILRCAGLIKKFQMQSRVSKVYKQTIESFFLTSPNRDYFCFSFRSDIAEGTHRQISATPVRRIPETSFLVAYPRRPPQQDPARAWIWKAGSGRRQRRPCVDQHRGEHADARVGFRRRSQGRVRRRRQKLPSRLSRRIKRLAVLPSPEQIRDWRWSSGVTASEARPDGRRVKPGQKSSLLLLYYDHFGEEKLEISFFVSKIKWISFLAVFFYSLNLESRASVKQFDHRLLQSLFNQ